MFRFFKPKRTELFITHNQRKLNYIHQFVIENLQELDTVNEDNDISISKTYLKCILLILNA